MLPSNDLSSMVPLPWTTPSPRTGSLPLMLWRTWTWTVPSKALALPVTATGEVTAWSGWGVATWIWSVLALVTAQPSGTRATLTTVTGGRVCSPSPASPPTAPGWTGTSAVSPDSVERPATGDGMPTSVAMNAVAASAGVGPVSAA